MIRFPKKPKEGNGKPMPPKITKHQWPLGPYSIISILQTLHKHGDDQGPLRF